MIGISISFLLTSVISTIINIFPNRKIINYGYIEQLSDIMHPLAISIVMGVLTYMVTFLDLPMYIMLIVQIIVGITSYILISKMTGLGSYSLIKYYFREVLNKKFHKSE